MNKEIRLLSIAEAEDVVKRVNKELEAQHSGKKYHVDLQTVHEIAHGSYLEHHPVHAVVLKYLKRYPSANSKESYASLSKIIEDREGVHQPPATR